ncbi:DUF2797 domain-containing protein [Streptomyces sp. NPDC058001]|uniref:DUF2797 domain-containing protein n=1 Tax=Streptomyces sp. NPDC058001 TaxID=3346300 RepID=UPI0036E6EA9B
MARSSVGVGDLATFLGRVSVGAASFERVSWSCVGVRWGEVGPRLRWVGGEGAERESALVRGRPIAFRVVGVRRCPGVWRGGRWVSCGERAVVPGRSTRGQCDGCARVDRAHSVAADTFLDDPRPYHVYLAWFGDGLVKVGITGVHRGADRLLEQGAVAFSWLGAGPLMAARRAEELLRAALRVPDRIPYVAKRAVRAELPGQGHRAAELTRLHRTARALDGWPESLEPLPCAVVDHGAVFGLDGLVPASGVVTELVTDAVVRGRLLAVAGPDLHLDVARSPDDDAPHVVVLDSRLMKGWSLVADDGLPGHITLPVRDVSAVQKELF